MNPEDNTDKYAHFGLSTAMTASGETFGKAIAADHRVTRMNRVVTTGIVFSIGIYKEVRDLNEGGRSRDSQRDLLADFVGVVTGNFIHWDF